MRCGLPAEREQRVGRVDEHHSAIAPGVQLANVCVLEELLDQRRLMNNIKLISMLLIMLLKAKLMIAVAAP